MQLHQSSETLTWHIASGSVHRFLVAEAGQRGRGSRRFEYLWIPKMLHTKIQAFIPVMEIGVGGYPFPIFNVEVAGSPAS